MTEFRFLNPHGKRYLLVCCVGVLAAAMAIPAAAQERNIQVGGVLGPNFSQLSGPTDPQGEVTVLAGTAFTGTGLSGGLTSALQLFSVPYGALFAELDALYSYQRGTGFAESRTTDARRELTLIAHMIRVPLFVRYDIVDDPLSIRFGLGPELLYGFSANHSTLVTGTEDPATQETFDTTTTTHFGLTGKLGLTFEVGGLRIPFDLRFTWDPMVPASTRDRFVGYQSFEDPGQYQVAYNFQFMALFGVEFDLTGDMGRVMALASSAAGQLRPQEKNERTEPPGESPPSPVAPSKEKKSKGKKSKEKSATPSKSEPGTSATGQQQGDVDVRKLRDTLWVDCREEPKHDRCARPSWLDPGTFGDGPSTETLPGFGTRMTDGFVDYQTGELIVGARFKTEQVLGYVVAVDLETGDRELISGRHENKDTGALVDVGSGPELGFVYDVELGPDGQIYAYYSPDESGTPHIARVDRETGDRELVWAARDDDFGQCVVRGDRTVLPVEKNFAIGSGGEFYVASSNSRPKGSGWGILSITADGSECSFVSISESDLGTDVGKGDENQTGLLDPLEMIGGTLWATHWQTQSLWAFNPSDGTRKRVSSSSNTVGTGQGDATVGTSGFAWVPPRDKFLTSGRAGRDTAVTWVDPTTGAREPVTVVEGPMEVGVYEDSAVWVHPSGKFGIYIVDEAAVVLFDPETGVSNIISM